MLKNLLLLALFTTAAHAADVASTQPTAVDLSTPKSAVRTMLTAVTSADGPTLGQVFEAQGPDAHELLSAYTDLIIAGRHLRDAAREKFATDAPAKPPAPAPPGASAEDLSQLNTADVQKNGDSAIVVFGDGRPPIKLHHSEIGWRIDLTDYAGVSNKQLAEQTELNRSLAAAMEEGADEIAAGKYASAQEAESGVQQKIHAVIAHDLKTVLPTTETTMPTTQTAPMH